MLVCPSTCGGELVAHIRLLVSESFQPKWLQMKCRRTCKRAEVWSVRNLASNDQPKPTFQRNYEVGKCLPALRALRTFPISRSGSVDEQALAPAPALSFRVEAFAATHKA